MTTGLHARRYRAADTFLDIVAAEARLPDALAAEQARELVDDRSLLYVTGKGGTGKTTVAGALGLAAAGRGRRTIVCEVGGADQLARAFARTPADGGETRLAERLWSLSVDPEHALDEWLRRQPGGAVVEAVLSRSDAFAHFVAAAPGVKELVTIGKVADLAGLAPGARPGPFDLVVVDGPSTGHALGMLAAPRSVEHVAALGPVGRQAGKLHAVLADQGTTGLVGVTLPEDMPVRELIELEDGLVDVLGRGLDLVVVDGVYPDRFTDEEADELRAAADRDGHASVIRAALAEHRRARIHAGHVEWLRARAPAPVITLPYVFSSAIGPAQYQALAGALVGG